MEVRFKKFTADAITPEFKTSGACAADLAAAERTVVKPGVATMVPLGIGIDTPENHVSVLSLRSSVPFKKGLFMPHGVGIIDSDYKGEYKAIVATIGDQEVVIEKGERFCQVMQIPCRGFFDVFSSISYKESAEIGESKRGEKGFGSTGQF